MDGRCLNSIAGTAGYMLPGLFIHIVYIFVDGKALAALRAAQGYPLSADGQFNFPTALFAFHVISIT